MKHKLFQYPAIPMALMLGLMACAPFGASTPPWATNNLIPTPMSYPFVLATITPGPYPALPPQETTAIAAYRLTQTAEPTITPTATSCPFSENTQNYYGCYLPPLPSGVTASGPGWLMADYKTSAETFIFEVVSQNDLRMLWLSKATGSYRQNGESVRELLAILILPILDESKTFVNNCKFKDAEIDVEIFAIAETTSNLDGEHSVIHKAWRANRKTFTFEPLLTQGMSCFISPMEYWR